MKKLAVIGSARSGGAAQVIDAVRTKSDYEPVGIFDNDPKAISLRVLGVPVLASSEKLLDYWKDDFFDEAVIAIGGNLEVRQKLYESFSEQGIPFANIIDSTAQVRSEVTMGKGNVILANVFIGPSVTIGDNCYIITNTCINHDSKLGSHIYFSAGCTIAGDVTIGDRVRFDTASGAKARVSIKNDIYVPAGKTLIHNPE